MSYFASSYFSTCKKEGFCISFWVISFPFYYLVGCLNHFSQRKNREEQHFQNSVVTFYSITDSIQINLAFPSSEVAYFGKRTVTCCTNSHIGYPCSMYTYILAMYAGRSHFGSRLNIASGDPFGS